MVSTRGIGVGRRGDVVKSVQTDGRTDGFMTEIECARCDVQYNITKIQTVDG